MRDSTPAPPRFAHGLALAALVPYAAGLAALMNAARALDGEHLSRMKFATTVIAVVGYPISLLLCGAVFGAAFVVHRRVPRSSRWHYVLWGTGGAALLLAGLVLAPPRTSLELGDVPHLLLVVLVGALAGLAFRFGAAPRAG